MDKTKNQITSFQDLRVWQEGHKLVLSVYVVTRSYPKEEAFGLVSQSRRCVVSITSNIAEGFGRASYKEKFQFFSIALGSLIELQNQLLIARDVRYIAVSEYDNLLEQATIVHKLLNAFMSKTKSFIN